MSKKHYIEFARIIAAEPNKAKRIYACEVIVQVASRDNPSFDSNRFRKACNVES